MINENFQKTIETLFCSMYSILLLSFVVIQIVLKDVLTFDLILFATIAIMLILMILNKKFLTSNGLYTAIWYSAFFSTSFWLIFKYLFFELRIFAMLIGLFGFYMGVYKINSLKQHVIISIVYSLILIPMIIIAPIDLEAKLIVNGIMFVIMVVSYYFKYIKIQMTERLLSMQLDSMALAHASEAFAVHDIILDSNNQPIDYRFVTVNKAFEKLTGLASQKVIGKTVLEVLPGIEKYWIEIYGDVAMNMVTTHYQNYSKELGRHYKVSAFPIVKGRFAVLFLDITDQVLNKEKLEASNDYVNKANRSKTQFLKDINHRIRTPLNGLLGTLQLYEELKEEDLLESIYLEAKHINNVVNQVSRYVEIQDYKHKLELNHLNNSLEAILNNISSEIEYKLINKNEEDLKILYDAKLLELILIKLVHNAWKYSHKKPVIIIVDYISDSTDKLKVKVKDAGPGLNESQKEYIFNEFYHHNINELYKDENHISLAMCKQILMTAGGEISVTNNQNHGSIFTIELAYNNYKS